MNKHLKEIQETAQKTVNELVEQLKAKSDLTEDMKNTDESEANDQWFLYRFAIKRGSLKLSKVS